MKTILRLFLFAPLLLGIAHAQTIITTGHSSGTHVIYDDDEITTSGTVQITGTADVTFVADNKITLNAGFKVAVGATFRTRTGTDVDGDGMPNAWEDAHGFNLLSAADAATDHDGDGLNNLVEYQLGTNPGGGSSNDDDDSGNPIGLKIHKPN